MLQKKALETSEDKIQEICHVLKNETLEPARNEAERIIKEAKDKAEHIIGEAEKQKKLLLEEAKIRIEQEKNVFHSSLSSAANQTIETLRQNVEEHFFQKDLANLIQNESSKPEILSKLILAIIKAVEEEGLSTDLAIVVPKAVSVKDVNVLLGDTVLNKLKDKSISLGGFEGGVQLKLLDKKITLDITDDTLLDLLTTYVRKDFRKFFFSK